MRAFCAQIAARTREHSGSDIGREQPSGPGPGSTPCPNRGVAHAPNDSAGCERRAADGTKRRPPKSSSCSAEVAGAATDPTALQLRASSGELVPLSAFTTLEPSTEVDVLLRVDGLRCAELRVLLDDAGHRDEIEARIRASHRASPEARLEIGDASRGP